MATLGFLTHYLKPDNLDMVSIDFVKNKPTFRKMLNIIIIRVVAHLVGRKLLIQRVLFLDFNTELNADRNQI